MYAADARLVAYGARAGCHDDVQTYSIDAFVAQQKPRVSIHAFHSLMVVSPAFPAKHHVYAGRATVRRAGATSLMRISSALIPRDGLVTVDRAGQPAAQAPSVRTTALPAPRFSSLACATSPASSPPAV